MTYHLDVIHISYLVNDVGRRFAEMEIKLLIVQVRCLTSHTTKACTLKVLFALDDTPLQNEHKN